MHVNGNSVLSGGPTDTKYQGSSGANQVWLQSLVNSTYSYFEDFYVCDDVGSIANSLLGDCRVELQLPDGAGNSTDWTPSTGSNYQCVDETAPNSDTDYVSNRTAGDHDSYTFDDIVTVDGEIYAVQTNMFARKNDAGTRQIKSLIRSGGSDYATGTTHTLIDSYKYYPDIYEHDPDTSSAWTISGVNAAEFGPKLEA